MRSFDTKMENTLLTIKAAATLHNVLMERQPLQPTAFDREDADGQLLDGEWRQLIYWDEGPRPRTGRAVSAWELVYFQLADFFGSPQGKIPWQWRFAGVERPQRAGDPPPAADSQPAADPPSHAAPGV